MLSTSMMTSKRGRCAGSAPRLRLAGWVRRRSLRCLRRVTGGFVFRSALLLILQAKPQLIEVELLGTRAKPMAQQTLDQQQQLLVLGLQLRHHLPQHPLQDIRIVRQCREVDLHIVMMMNVVASLPMTLA